MTAGALNNVLLTFLLMQLQSGVGLSSSVGTVLGPLVASQVAQKRCGDVVFWLYERSDHNVVITFICRVF